MSDNEDKMRPFVVRKFATILDIPVTHAVCINLEKNIFNWTIVEAKRRNETPSWENPKVKDIYKQKYCSIKYNLEKSPDLKDTLIQGHIKTKDVVLIGPDGLWNGGPHNVMVDKHTKENMRIEILNEVQEKEGNEYVGLFKCERCKSMNTTFVEMQCRSADEPMSKFIFCRQKDCLHSFCFKD